MVNNERRLGLALAVVIVIVSGIVLSAIFTPNNRIAKEFYTSEVEIASEKPIKVKEIDGEFIYVKKTTSMYVGLNKYDVIGRSFGETQGWRRIAYTISSTKEYDENIKYDSKFKKELVSRVNDHGLKIEYELIRNNQKIEIYGYEKKGVI